MKKFPDNQTAKGVKPNTVMADWFDNELRILILRGPAAFCTYLGVPIGHPLAGFFYDDIQLDCHGGLTFSTKGGGMWEGKNIHGESLNGVDKPWPAGYWWYGYDYAHIGDKMHFDYPPKLQKDIDEVYSKYPNAMVEKDWTLGEIKRDSWGPIYDMKKLMKLAERIAENAKQ